MLTLGIVQASLALLSLNRIFLSVVIMPDVVTDDTKRYKVPEKWRPANIVR